jgi:hypothetical protein
VPNGAVLARGVHTLKDQQHRVAPGRVVKLSCRNAIETATTARLQTAP